MELQRHTDQMNREIWLPKTPKRVVSLVPSQTEYLFDLGLGERLLGRTLFCIHPKEELRHIRSVGGTKKLQIDAIRALQPDLIIGNKEENEQSQIELLSQEFPVWMSDIYTPNDALWMMQALGEILNLTEKSQQIVSEVQSNLEAIKQKSNRFNGIKVLYAIWKSPWMMAGKQTFIDALLSEAGFSNQCRSARYPEMDEETIASSGANFLFLSSEPYPFRAKHVNELKAAFPAMVPVLVDGEMFSWYGSRLKLLDFYLDQLETELHKKPLHP